MELNDDDDDDSNFSADQFETLERIAERKSSSATASINPSQESYYNTVQNSSPKPPRTLHQSLASIQTERENVKELPKTSLKLFLHASGNIAAKFQYHQIIVSAIRNIPKATWHAKERLWMFPMSSLSSAEKVLSETSGISVELEALYPAVYKNFHDYGNRYCKGVICGAYQDASYNEKLHNFMEATVMIHNKDVLSELPMKCRQQVLLDLAEKDTKQINENFLKLEIVKSKISACQSEEAEKLKFSQKNLSNKIYTDSAEAKVPSVLDFLGTVVQEDCKFLIFAHHQPMVDAIRQYLQKKKVGCIRIDGGTPAASRHALVTDFQEKDDIEAALSIRGSGLTLKAATTVIFAELPWTPEDIFQAEDRAHHIGQVSSLNVYFLLTNDAVDDIIWGVVQSKLELGQLEPLNPDVYKNFHDYGNRYCKGVIFGAYQGASYNEELHNFMEATVMIHRLNKDVLSELPVKCRQQVLLDLAEKDTKQINANFVKPEALYADVYKNFHDYGNRYCEGIIFGAYQGVSNHKELHNLMKAPMMIRRINKDVLSEFHVKRKQQVFLDLAEKERWKQINALFRELEMVKNTIGACHSKEEAEKLKFSQKNLNNKVSDTYSCTTIVVMLLKDRILLGADSKVTHLDKTFAFYHDKLHHCGKGVYFGGSGALSTIKFVKRNLSRRLQRVVWDKSKKTWKVKRKRPVTRLQKNPRYRPIIEYSHCIKSAMKRLHNQRGTKNRKAYIVLAKWEKVQNGPPAPRSTYVTRNKIENVVDIHYSGSGSRYARKYIQDGGGFYPNSTSKFDGKERMLGAIREAAEHDETTGGPTLIFDIEFRNLTRDRYVATKE